MDLNHLPEFFGICAWREGAGGTRHSNPNGTLAGSRLTTSAEFPRFCAYSYKPR